MLIIDKGKKVIEGRARDLFDPMNIVVDLKTTAIGRSWQILQQSPWKDQLLQQGKDSILLKLPQRDQPSLVRYLVEQGEELVSFHAKNTLEDYFLSLTSGQQHVEAFTD
jgi:ABC-type multidrug transport system ATPase subunit